MFNYDERENFTDLMRPPSGYKTDRCIGTTYSLDFLTLTAGLLALADYDIKENLSSIPPSEFLQVLNKIMHKVSIYHNKSSINIPNDFCKNKLFVLYDRLLNECYEPNSSFHPKVWLMKYIAKDNPAIYRIICGSRNLTVGQNWEAAVAVEGIKKQTKTTMGKNIHSFFNNIINNADKERFSDLLDEIQYVSFYTNNKTYDFHHQTIGNNKFIDELIDTSDSMMIVSPFIRGSFLKKVLSNTNKLILLSTQRELDSLYITDKKLVDDLLDKHELYVVETLEDGQENTYELHAKIYILSNKDNHTVFIGSANASHRGWSNNTEALISIDGLIGYKDFYNGFIYDKERKQLNPWIKKYTHSLNTELKTELEINEIISTIQNQINKLKIIAEYKLNKIILKTDIPINIDFHSNITAMIALYSKPDSFYNLIELNKGIVIDGINVEDLTAFILVKIRYISSDITKEKIFIIKVKTNYADQYENREIAIYNKYIDYDAFQHFMFSILFTGSKYYSAINRFNNNKAQNKGKLSLLQNISIEDIIQACANDDEKVNEIDSFLKKCPSINNEFISFWIEFKKAIKICQN